MVRLFLAVLLLVFHTSRSEEARLTRVWKGPFFGKFPESPYLSLTPNTGVCLSGGGSRAYTAGLGQLRALLDLDLLKNVRYLAGVSGGAWATAAFSYAQTPHSDETLLGPYWEPEEITLETIKADDIRSARSAVSKPVIRIIVEEVALDIFHGQTIHRAYERALSRIFLEPVGITSDALYTWNAETRADIVNRNPSLGNRQWVTPTHNKSHYRPFPIIETTLLGPLNLIPFAHSERNFIQSEMTPLYVGRPHVSNVTYTSKTGIQESHLIGGLVEPFIYGGMPPEDGFNPNKTIELVNASAPKEEFSIGRFITESSWNFADRSEGKRYIEELLGGNVPYWSPAAVHPKPFWMDIADGGDLDNTGLMSMLRRRVERVIIFDNTYIPLAPKSVWNPHERLPLNTEFDSMLAAYFGIFIDPPSERAFNYRTCQVFATDAFADFAARLQESQHSGRGAVATTKLTTISNPGWGIPAGVVAEITWVYLSRMLEWERRLQPEVAAAVVPLNSTTSLPIEDPSQLKTSGTFKSFPAYPTENLELHPNQANLLATLAASSVRMNEAIFQKALGTNEDGTFTITSPSAVYV